MNLTRMGGVLIALAVSSLAVAKSLAIVDVIWSDDCTTITITSTKDISNIVRLVDDGFLRTEFQDGFLTLVLDATDVETIWVKSGRNHSGDGPGFGERFDRPDRCDEVADCLSAIDNCVSCDPNQLSCLECLPGFQARGGVCVEL